MPAGKRPAPPVGSCKIVIGGTTLTHLWKQVFYCNLTGSTITVNDLQALCDEINTLWSANIKAQQCSTTIMSNVQAVYIPSVGNETVAIGTYTETGTNVGTQIQDAAAAFVISWKTTRYYRGGHPRSYMAGVPSSAITNGSNVASATQTAVASAWSTFKSGLNAFTSTNITGTQMGTVSFASGNAWRSPPIFVPFTDVGCAATLGSQRRRIHS